MSCQRCGSPRMLIMNSRCCDQFFVKLNGHRHAGMVLDGLGIGGGEYVGFDLCLDCGQVQGKFPVPKTDLEEGKLPSPDNSQPKQESLSTDFLKDLLG